DLISSAPRAPLPPFAQLDEFGRGYFPREVYEEARAQQRFDVHSIQYRSGGHSVGGVMVRPRDSGNRRWPVIIYNRGGTGDFGRLDDLNVVDFYLWAKAGFVVVASDYRFRGERSRRDEWGGADVDDILNLVPLVRALPFVDPDRLFMIGVSRGGTMAYLALKRGIPVRAAAIIAGPSDLEAFGRARPEFVDGDAAYDGWSKVWPDYAHNAATLYRDRSAVRWADRIEVPVLILHSRRDRMVPVSQALEMAAALQAAGKVYALHIYDNDGHSLPLNRDDRNRQIVDWFNREAQRPR
ncbi:MAG: prolyl oligopeptidase family serine peptidase, partial [Vicinamibacterales bacterium]